jgi:hypothetical protein
MFPAWRVRGAVPFCCHINDNCCNQALALIDLFEAILMPRTRSVRQRVENVAPVIKANTLHGIDNPGCIKLLIRNGVVVFPFLLELL